MNRIARFSAVKPRAVAGGGSHRYWAFLSYSHDDAAHADWLHHALETYRVPKAMVGRLSIHGAIPRKLSPIFRDRHELAASADLGQTIREALGQSRFLIVLCSPTAATSRWVNEEILAFKKANGEDRVLAAIVEGEPFASDIAGREAEECFPPALRFHIDRRGKATTRRAEPVAADLRESGDGRKTGLLKLVAGMFGLGLDDLVQREEKRRQRRLTYIAAASIAGMAVTSGLAIFAFSARDEARDQRREAEGLVEFMVGDLKDKLEPIGKLDALGGVGDRVLAYYSKQDASDLTDAGLLQRSRALSIIAQVAYSRGDLDGAAKLYAEAMAGTGEAVARSPNDPQRLFDHAQNAFWIGELARRRGQLDQAEQSYRQYKQLADRMIAIEPDNIKWRMEVQYARVNLGIALMGKRRFAEAAVQFGDALGPMESLAAIDPAKTEYQQEVSNNLAWLADARVGEGKLDDAIAMRQRQLAHIGRQLQSEATNVQVQEQVVPARQALGLLYSYRGQSAKAIEQFTIGLAQAARLRSIEPDNSEWRDSEASIRFELARSLIATGAQGEAAAQVAQGCAAAAELQRRDPEVPRWRALGRSCFSARARLALASGDARAAEPFANQALVAAVSSKGNDPVQRGYAIAAAFRLHGDVFRRLGNEAAARASFEKGLAAIRPGNARPPEMAEHATLLRRLARIEEARAIERRLAAIGYAATS